MSLFFLLPCISKFKGFLTPPLQIANFFYGRPLGQTAPLAHGMIKYLTYSGVSNNGTLCFYLFLNKNLSLVYLLALY